MAKSLYRRIQIFFRSLFGRDSQQSDLDEEILLHIEELTDEFIEEGMSPTTARKAALKRFGSVEWVKDDTRDSWGLQRLADSIRDFKFGLRLMIKHLSSSILAVIILSLGIGISTMMFTAATKLLDTSAGTDLDDRQMYLEWEVGKARGLPISTHDFNVLQKEVDSLENLVGIQHSNFFVRLPSEEDRGKQYGGAITTPNFFTLIKDRPVQGRIFNYEDIDSNHPKVVVSDLIRSDFFGDSSSVIGETVLINETLATIVGVMPKGFAFPENKQIWMPTDWKEYEGARRVEVPRISVSGKLKPRLSIGQARAELQPIAVNLATEFPETNENYTRFRITPYQDRFLDDDAFVITTIFGVFGSLIVLSFACANVFQIIIARTAIRSHELAVRCSLGAKRTQVIWQVIVDGLTLSGIGAILGLGLAVVGLRFASNQLTVFNMPGLHTFQLTPMAIFFVLAVSLITGLASSIIPAWRASKINAYEILKDDSKSSGSIYIGWLSKTLVISQVAFSSILLFFSMFLLFPTLLIDAVKTPYKKDTILTASVRLQSDPSITKPEHIEAFYNRLKQKLQTVPGVRATALTSAEFGILAKPTDVQVEGIEVDPSQLQLTQFTVASPDLLEIYNHSVISGRMINRFDTQDAPKVCVVSEKFANIHYLDSDPIGKRVSVKEVDDRPQWLTIVGVIPDTNMDIPTFGENDEAMMEQIMSAIVVPFTQHIYRNPTILLSAANASSGRYRQAVREAITEIVPKARIQGSILTIEERFNIVKQLLASMARGGQLFGGAILLMSIIGLYSIISFTTAQRRRELGIRMAVGSTSWQIAKSVLKPWSIAILSGIVVGAFACYALSSVLGIVEGRFSSMKSTLYEMAPVFAPVVIIIGIASLLSMALPAWRAIKIAPMEVIRVE